MSESESTSRQIESREERGGGGRGSRVESRQEVSLFSRY
jgi:hypothetical protein